MNYDLILKYLDTYSDRELFYQRYQEKKKNPEEFARFLGSLNAELLKKQGVSIPEFSQADGPSSVPVMDDRRFEAADNRDASDILLSKIDRFAPPVLHTHTFFEVLYVLRGSCRHFVFGREELLREGDLCLLSPAMTHTVSSVDGALVLDISICQKNIMNTFYNILRDDSRVSSLLKNSIYLKDYATYLTFRTGGDKDIQSQLLEMYAERHFHSDLYSERIVSGMLVIFFSRLLRKYQNSAESPAETVIKTDASRLLEYILQDYRTITLSDLARKLNYSVPYCSKYIKEATGYTFLQLLQKTRFQIAENYLRTSPLSIQKISALLGYENPENFIRAFKKVYGISPAKFRAQH